MTFELNVFYVFLATLFEQEEVYDACDSMSKVEVRFVRRTRRFGLQGFGPFDARITSAAVQDDEEVCEIEVFFDDAENLPPELMALRLGFCAKVRFGGVDTPCGEAYPLW